jgi:hypothetical protein
MAVFEFHKGRKSLDDAYYLQVQLAVLNLMEEFNPVFDKHYTGTVLIIVDPRHPMVIYLKSYGEYPEYYLISAHISVIIVKVHEIINKISEKFNYSN